MFRAKRGATGKSTYAFLVIFALFLLAGCAQKMADQPKIKPLTASDFFADGQASRSRPPNTVAHSETVNDELLNTGKIDGQDADMFPYPITKDIILRGQREFNIYCSTCHDRTGQGNGMVVQNGYASPPVLTIDPVLTDSVGTYFDAITNGFAVSDVMPSYASQIAVNDRWAIIAYIRALQYSQNATMDDVPPEIRPTLEAQK